VLFLSRVRRRIQVYCYQDKGYKKDKNQKATGDEPAEQADDNVDLKDKDNKSAAEKATEVDPWKGADPKLTEERNRLLDANKKLEHQAKSDAGRVSGLQRQINNLLHNQSDSTRPSQKEITDAIADPEQMEAFLKDYPEVASAITSLLNVQEAKIRKEVQQTISPLIEDKYDRESQRETSQLKTPKEEGGFGHPDWESVVKTPEWYQWLEAQPVKVQDLIKSPHAADAAWLLDRFKQDKKPAVDISTGGGKSEVELLEERRQQKLKSGEGIPTNSRTSRKEPPEAPDDYDSGFEANAKKKDNQRRR